MPSVLIICDDEVRRAKLHKVLTTDFEVFTTDHESAKSMKNRIQSKDVIIVEEMLAKTENGEKGFAIYPMTKKDKARFGSLTRKVIKCVEAVVKEWKELKNMSKRIRLNNISAAKLLISSVLFLVEN